VFLSIEIDQAFARGPSNWKFNNTLLKNNEYINLIKSNYPSIQENYQNVENRQLYWELLKMEIRSTTIAYSKKKKSNLRNCETVIQRKLEELDTEICKNQMEFENLKKELTEIYSIKGKRQCSDQEPGGSKMARNRRNISSIWKNGITRKRL